MGMRRPDSPASGFKFVSTTAITAFAAGFPAMVTRPAIEAARRRLSRAGVCALDWLTAIRSNIDNAENRLSRPGFTGRLLLLAAATVEISPAFIVFEK